VTTYAFLNLPAWIHIDPTLLIVKELVARGDDVYYFTGEEFRCHVRFTIDQMTPLYP
jgi:UDP:flavonoid glycosyltransferase YjiC (YdhE family)